MLCSECQSKFTFKERLKSTSILNGSITCSNCGNTFVKDKKFRVLDIIIGLTLDISIMVGLIYFINSIYNNLQLATVLAIIIGQVINIAYMLLIQNFRRYKKCNISQS